MAFQSFFFYFMLGGILGLELYLSCKVEGMTKNISELKRKFVDNKSPKQSIDAAFIAFTLGENDEAEMLLDLYLKDVLQRIVNDRYESGYIIVWETALTKATKLYQAMGKTVPKQYLEIDIIKFYQMSKQIYSEKNLADSGVTSKKTSS